MLKRKPFFYFVLFFAYIFISLGFATEVQAQGSFTYKVLHPENQYSSAGYFDLRMMPGQTQVVQIELNNPSEDTPVTVDVKLNSTKTNSNGVLEYGPSAIEKDASLTIDFEQVVTGPAEIVLEPLETKTVDLTIAMPAESYDGVVAGGIELMARLTEDELTARDEAGGISNEYAFLIGMLLTETDTPVSPEIAFNSIRPDLSNYRNAIFVNFSNTERVFLSNMSIDFQVMRQGSDDILYDTRKTEMRMAPNSMIDFPVLMGGDQMEAGDYTGHVVVTSGDRVWEWTQDFTITQEESDKFNQQDVSLVQERGMDWKLIAAIVGGVLALLLIIFIIVRVINRKKQGKTVKGKKQAKRKVIKKR